MLKPDAIERNLEPYIAGALYIRGLRVSERRPINLTMDAISRLYVQPGEGFANEGALNGIWLAVSEYMVNKPCELWVVEGENAVQHVHEAKWALRTTFRASEAFRNVVHSPDRDEDVERELAILESLPPVRTTPERAVARTL